MIAYIRLHALALDFGVAIGDDFRQEDEMRNWPDLLGLTSEDGRYVVVDRPTPATYLQFDRSEVNSRCNLANVRSRNLRPDETTANGAILATVLMTLMNAKRKAADLYEFNRGTPCCQFIDGENGPTFYLYEGGYRASLYPAWIWRLPRFQSSPGYVRPLWEIICLEMASKDIVGQQDNRSAATIGSVMNGVTGAI
jgi:hypothetical protein